MPTRDRPQRQSETSGNSACQFRDRIQDFFNFRFAKFQDYKRSGRFHSAVSPQSARLRVSQTRRPDPGQFAPQCHRPASSPLTNHKSGGLCFVKHCRSSAVYRLTVYGSSLQWLVISSHCETASGFILHPSSFIFQSSRPDLPIHAVQPGAPDFVLRIIEFQCQQRIAFGTLGWRTNFMRASCGVRPPFWMLQLKHAQTTFSQVVSPPRLRGMT